MWYATNLPLYTLHLHLLHMPLDNSCKFIILNFIILIYSKVYFEKPMFCRDEDLFNNNIVIINSLSNLMIFHVPAFCISAYIGLGNWYY